MGKLYDAICRKFTRVDKVLIVALDDINFLDREVANEVLYALLKAHEEFEVKIGVVAAATERLMLDVKVTSIFSSRRGVLSSI